MTFLDTGFLFALISTKDEHHARVVEVFRTFKIIVDARMMPRELQEEAHRLGLIPLVPD